MGVAGCGKTTLGRALADRLGWEFLDADDFHPKQNVDKMSRGEPLNDDDRRPWLEELRDLLREIHAQGRSAVLACSALKQSYRDILNASGASPRWVFIRGTQDQISARLASREGHFMKPGMLLSQLATLEEPANATVLDVTMELDQKIDAIRRVL